VSDGYGRTVITDSAPRCWRCSRLLALFVSRPWKMRCPRCKATNADGSKAPDEE
jgi:phage FluMu protein Com